MNNVDRDFIGNSYEAGEYTQITNYWDNNPFSVHDSLDVIYFVIDSYLKNKQFNTVKKLIKKTIQLNISETLYNTFLLILFEIYNEESKYKSYLLLKEKNKFNNDEFNKIVEKLQKKYIHKAVNIITNIISILYVSIIAMKQMSVIHFSSKNSYLFFLVFGVLLLLLLIVRKKAFYKLYDYVIKKAYINKIS